MQACHPQDYEEDGHFPQLLAIVQFCLIATAGFGMKVEEVSSLCVCVRLYACTQEARSTC